MSGPPVHHGPSNTKISSEGRQRGCPDLVCCILLLSSPSLSKSTLPLSLSGCRAVHAPHPCSVRIKGNLDVRVSDVNDHVGLLLSYLDLAVVFRVLSVLKKLAQRMLKERRPLRDAGKNAVTLTGTLTDCLSACKEKKAEQLSPVVLKRDSRHVSDEGRPILVSARPSDAWITPR
jgi:hypothetical protein